MDKFVCDRCKLPTERENQHDVFLCVAALKAELAYQEKFNNSMAVLNVRLARDNEQKLYIINALLWVIDQLRRRLLIVGFRRDKLRRAFEVSNEHWLKVVEAWKKQVTVKEKVIKGKVAIIEQLEELSKRLLKKQNYPLKDSPSNSEYDTSYAIYTEEERDL